MEKWDRLHVRPRTGSRAEAARAPAMNPPKGWQLMAFLPAAPTPAPRPVLPNATVVDRGSAAERQLLRGEESIFRLPCGVPPRAE